MLLAIEALVVVALLVGVCAMLMMFPFVVLLVCVKSLELMGHVLWPQGF